MNNESETLSCSLSTSIGDIDGAILSMHVRNFFCHSNLEIKFHKNINFVVGRNGSGKSAILTALVVGLGGRAAATNRGTSLSSFVKKGANSAHIEIKIKNDSPHAYKHDVYGDEITVIRTITASGGSNYRIKSKSGQTISTKYDDVAMICSVHDIQVDNPVCVLNQDDARNFHASDPKKKYSLFRKATNMDVVESNYKKALKKCEQAKMTLEKKKQAFQMLEKELQKLKTQYDEMRSRDEVQAHMRSLEDEYHWSEIADMEKDYRQISKELNRQTTKVNNINEQLCKLQREDLELQLSYSNIQEKLNEVNAKFASQDAKYQSMCQSLQELKVQWKQSLEELKKKREYIARENAKVKDLTREVNAATNVNLDDERKSLQAKLAQTQQKLEEIIARKDTTSNELNQTRGAISHEQSKLVNTSRKKESIQNSLRQVKSMLNELNVRGKDSLAVYGKHMTDLVAGIKAAHSRGVFSEMPRGPVGAYLKVKDKKWSSALEHIIGGSLKTFCVNNDKDSKALFGIMQKVYGNEAKPSITTSKFYNKVHDVSSKSVRAPHGLFSSLDCLLIDDPVISNFLIDEIRMETILLVSTHDQAISVTSDESRVPQNLFKVVTVDQTEFYPAPNYRSYGGRGRPSHFLQVSTNERKRQLQEEYSTQEKNLENLIEEYNQYKDECNKLSRHEEEFDLVLRKLLKARQTLEGQIDSIKANLRELEGGHIKVLTEELNQSKEKLVKLEEEERKLTEEESSFRTRTKSLEAEKNALKQERDSQQLLLNEELSNQQLQLERNKSSLLMAQQTFNHENQKLQVVTEKHAQSQEEINGKIQKAEQLCSRIENTRPTNIIISELKKVKKKMESLQRSGPSKQQVADTLIEKETLHRTTSKIIYQLGVLIERLQKVVNHHLHTAIQLQALIGNRVQYCFQLILKVRGYLGSMEIENEKGILEIKCTGRDSAAVRTASSTRSLSGGERSYATVAFIMALWDCMELPFYFLDEFDVFMDNVNRKTTMELLIDHAKTNPHRQYVFLTPQDTSILNEEEVKIHRLADPIRESLSQA